MADDESRLIQALNDAKDNETLLKELNSFHLTVSTNFYFIIFSSYGSGTISL